MVALALLVAAIAVGFGFGIRLSGSNHFPGAPDTFGEWPVLGEWLPHIGIGTPLSIMVAIAVVAWGPGLASRLRWRTALVVGYVASVGWILSLALIDGWQRGVAGQLTSQDEYLSAVPAITDVGVFLRTFSSRILDFQPDSLITHVAGHPPGATLVFVGLDRLGLSGGGWAAVLCVLVGALTAVAVPVAVAALGKPELARATLPFIVLFPGAVWMGVSADALFAGVTACGIALLALRTRVSAMVGGVLLGFGAFLSYGLALIAVLALVVCIAVRSWRTLGLAVLAACVVVAVFAWAGFWWFDGYHLVVERYYQGIANDRPYWYWVWANLACLTLVIGPAVAAGLPRAWRFPLVAAAIVVVLLADVSGLSKSEVERIWLPFAVWLVPAAGFLPRQRWWLAAQAATALMVNHLLLTNW
nr:putative membrane protein [Kibdelosporangium sp. MJ126-NF4]